MVIKNISSGSDSSKNKLKALDELFEQSISYRTSKEFLGLLEFINKFPYLSPFNAFLVHMQNRGVDIVMSVSKWKKYNRVPKYPLQSGLPT